MTRLVTWYCPDITCAGFGEPVSVMSYEPGESTGGMPDIAVCVEPVNDDEGRCGNCDSHMAASTQFTTAIARAKNWSPR